METVQLQCGSCQKLMAISVAHLGGQVQCPHCRAVVQTPAPAKAPVPSPLSPPAHIVERESIFSGPEASDDVFGGGPTLPLVEMPHERAPAPPEIPQTIEFTPEPGVDHFAAPPAPQYAPAAESDGADEHFPTHTPRPIYDKGMAPLIALIFLIPYSIVTTLFIVYLLMQAWNQPHPLDMLPDPKEGKGSPRKVERIKHDFPLAAHQKVALGGSLRVGDLEVQPQRVELNREGNLVLRLQVKNRSGDMAFAPIHDQFLHVQNDRVGGKPYTFLQSDNLKPIYGAFLQVKKGDRELNEGEQEIAPGQDEVILLTTMDNERTAVKKFVGSTGRLVWRVQLRRGPVSHQGKLISATTVIGVQFTARDIAKET
jgi:phage FluMu protein Com